MIYYTIIIFILLFYITLKEHYPRKARYTRLVEDKITKPKKSILAIIINAYRKDWLDKQIINFDKFITCDYIVILNCSIELYNKLKKEKLPNNYILHPKPFNKKRFHGSLFKGIISNIEYLIKNKKISYFLILSNKTIFLDNFSLKYINQIPIDKSSLQTSECKTWHWPNLHKTKLSKYFLKRSNSQHEGLLLSYDAAKYVINFLNSHNNIKQNLYEFNSCIEEFAIQTIILNSKYNYKIISYFHAVPSNLNNNIYLYRDNHI